MKRGHAILFAIIVVLLFTLLYVSNKMQQKEFNWEPDFRTYNKHPFGGYVLDKMLKASWEEDFTHSYKNLYRLQHEGLLMDENVLILANQFSTSETEANALFDYIADGHSVLIAASNFDGFEYRMSDTLRFHIHTESWFNYFQIQLHTDTLKANCELSLCSSSFGEKKFKLPELLTTYHFDSIPDNTQVIALKNDSLPVAIQFPIGEGKLILCTHPTLFSNYGILSEQNEYVWGLLSSLNDAPLIRTEYYQVGNEEESDSSFRYILSQRPLRWAFYITLITLALLILFTAKRKQKTIPVIRKPDNQLLNFVRSMAALYLKKSNNGDMLKKKYLLFAEQLLKDYHIDVINRPHNLAMYERIAQKTGTDLQLVRELFNGLSMLDSDFEISDAVLMDLVGKMDRIVP